MVDHLDPDLIRANATSGAATTEPDAIDLMLAKINETIDALNPAPGTSSYLDTFSRANQSGLGAADTGQAYEITGAGAASCAILNGRYVGQNPPIADATIYAGVIITPQPISIGGTVSFVAGPGAGSAGAIALISSSDASITLQHMVHLVLTPTSCNVTWWNGATQNQQMAQGGWQVNFATPLLTDGTAYSILMTINGDNVHVDLPDGTSHDWYDPLVSTLAGSLAIFELQYDQNSTCVPRWDSTVSYDGSSYSVQGALRAAQGLINTPIGTQAKRSVGYFDRVFPNKVLIGTDENTTALVVSDATTEQARFISTGNPARIALENNAGTSLIGTDTHGVGDVGLIVQTGATPTTRLKVHGNDGRVEVVNKLIVGDEVTVTVASTEQMRLIATGGTARLAFETNAGATYNNFVGADVLAGGDVGVIIQTGNGSANTRFAVHTDGTVEAIGAFKASGDAGFFGTTPIAKPTVTGSRGGNAALASLLTALANLGLITDSTSA